VRSGICFITTPHAVVSYPRPLLYDLTNCANVARYSPSSIRPDSTFSKFLCPTVSSAARRGIKNGLLLSGYLRFRGGRAFQKRISKITLLMCSPELRPSHLLIFPQMCAGWVKHAEAQWFKRVWSVVRHHSAPQPFTSIQILYLSKSTSTTI